MRRLIPSILVLSILAAPTVAPRAQSARTSVTPGRRYSRLVIRNAKVIDGNATPVSGPYDIVLEGGVIREMVGLDAVAVASGSARRPAQGDAEIDAAGKFVMPGLINLHGHVQDERAGVAQPLDYELKLWLASGITTVRDVGSDMRKTLALKRRSEAGEVACPRLFVYAVGGGARNVEQARARVRELKAQGADGLKFFGMDRDLMAAAWDEAHKQGLRIAHHAAVAETNAWDDARFGTTSIEHWYGIPDAAIEGGVQNFPPEYNYSDEVDRFRHAGHLWREANWDRLMKVFDAMIEAKVAWNPTLDIYEASRDLQRAQTQPWFADYLHPTLEDYFRPDPGHHGSYFLGWTSTDETFWKENYRIWMAALKEFDRRGGLVGAGEDAGFIYQMYGFGLIRELELKQEAGFHTLKVIQQATGNNARILGQEDKLGRVRPGFAADLLVVNGNPLENLKVLYPTGVDVVKDGRQTHTGGVEWTIKDGIPYHGPTLLADVKEMVAKARAERRAKAATR
ncbi:MAG: amidohydrolase family protein [Acidobacteria bacterium]|nr:amidohydrolase family protein [Acidobacteriota bacterium]MCA1641105.1 amidohydrolase family protein [Acidobacteriota bacterium]